MARLLQAAQRELRQIARHYNHERGGLGEEFIERFRLAVRAVDESPSSWSPWLAPGVPEGFRHAPLDPFPHYVVFTLEPFLLVVAVAHPRRDPTYWVARLAP